MTTMTSQPPSACLWAKRPSKSRTWALLKRLGNPAGLCWQSPTADLVVAAREALCPPSAFGPLDILRIVRDYAWGLEEFSEFENQFQYAFSGTLRELLKEDEIDWDITAIVIQKMRERGFTTPQHRIWVEELAAAERESKPAVDFRAAITRYPLLPAAERIFELQVIRDAIRRDGFGESTEVLIAEQVNIVYDALPEAYWQTKVFHSVTVRDIHSQLLQRELLYVACRDWG